MRVGLVLDDTLDSPDGVQQYVLRVGEWLQAHGHEVFYLVGESRREDLTNLYSIGRNVRVKFNGNALSIPLPAQRKQLRKLLDDMHLDILHVQTPYSPFLGGRLIELVGPEVAVVGTFHILPYSVLSNVGSRMLGAWNARTAKRFDDVIAVSSPAQRYAKRYYKLECHVVPNGFDMPLFTLKQPASRQKNIKFLGRLVERKGPYELLRAIAQRAAQEPWPQDWRVVIGGKGPLAAKMQKYIKQHNMEAFVELAGFIAEEDKARFLADADIAVFPSLAGESFGISLLEAFAAARGVVLAGDNPGYRSVMEGFEVQLFKPKDTTGFAELLRSWMQDNAGRAKIANAQKRYVRRFDMQAVGAEIARVYETALQKRRGS